MLEARIERRAAQRLVWTVMRYQLVPLSWYGDAYRRGRDMRANYPRAANGSRTLSGVYEAACELDQLSGRFAGLVDAGLRDEFRRVGSFVTTRAGGIEPLQ